MNQTKIKFSGIFKKILLILLLTTVSVILFVCALGFCLHKVPHYENYYFLIPYIILFFAAWMIVLFSKLIGNNDLFLVLLCTLVLSFVSLLISIFSQMAKGNLLVVLIRMVLFVIFTLLFSILLQKSKKKRVSNGKFRFGK